MTLETGAAAPAPARPRSAAIVNLGCKVNQSEMEAAARLLRARGGIPLVEPARAADLYLVNTCTVTSTADEKSRSAVRRARRANPGAQVVVTGCSVQVDPETYRGARCRRPTRRQRGQGRVPRGAGDPPADRRRPRGSRRRRAARAAGRRLADPLGRGSGHGRRHGRCRRRPRVGRADPGVRQGPGRLLVPLHVLHHPARPRRASAPWRPTSSWPTCGGPSPPATVRSC